MPQNQLAVMSFGDHLEELRSRIIRSIGVTVVGIAVALIFQTEIVEVFTAPHRAAMHAILVERRVASATEDVRGIEAAAGQLQSAEVAKLIAVTERHRARGQRLESFRQWLPAVADPGQRDFFEFLIAEAERGERTTDQLGVVHRLERRVAEVRTIAEELARQGGLFSNAATDELQGAAGALSTTVEKWRTEAGSLNPAVDAFEESAWTRIEDLERRASTVRNHLEPLVGGEEEAASRLHAFSYPEQFFSYLKVCFLVGLLLGLPWITIEMWRFVAAGLYPKERRAVAPFIPLSLLGLVLGGVFAYTVIVPIGLTYLGSYGSQDLVEPTFRLSDYISLVTTLMVGMGLVFQLPLVMVFAARAGFASPEIYRRYRKYAIVGSLILASFLTPPDVVTQLLMGGPLILLYEVGILVSAWLARRPADTVGTPASE
ncbi:MAG: twin-arginine translocase subunit TatC [Planctomycetes bacterium]|nr:twin-arginine translocase subunit TatC [Planctomycetota bacterium]